MSKWRQPESDMPTSGTREVLPSKGFGRGAAAASRLAYLALSGASRLRLPLAT